MDSEYRSKMRSPRTLCSFFTLAIIRGTFAIAVHYGILAYKGPSLLFLLRTPGTIALFLISMIYLASKEEEAKLEIVNDLKSSRSYKRAALTGLIQLCGPYLLFMYAMKYFSPTLGAVFMAATPWMTALLEKIVISNAQTGDRKDWNVNGLLVGLAGVVLVSIANISMETLDTSCEAKYENVTEYVNQSGVNGSIVHVMNTTRHMVQEDMCDTPVEITTAFLALCGATLLWSVSAVFSRFRRVSSHFLTGGLLNNVFGGLYAGILWVVLEQHVSKKEVIWNSFSGSISVIFLTLASSWIAAIVLYQLLRRIGAESTNRVMCLVPLITWVEDHMFTKHYKHMYLWMFILEAIGLFLVVVGLYVSSLRKGQSSRMRQGLLSEYESSGEEDGEIQRHVDQLTQTVQSEEELQESGTSTMQDSAEPPMLHYADDEEDGDQQLW